MNVSNQNRTSEYLKIFNREVVVKSLIDKDNPTIFDVARDNFKKELNWKERAQEEIENVKKGTKFY